MKNKLLSLFFVCWKGRERESVVLRGKKKKEKKKKGREGGLDPTTFKY